MIGVAPLSLLIKKAIDYEPSEVGTSRSSSLNQFCIRISCPAFADRREDLVMGESVTGFEQIFAAPMLRRRWTVGN